MTALPLPSLIELCRSLRHLLSAGLTVRDVFSRQAERGPAAVRPIASGILRRFDEGDDVAGALESHREAFPPLFLSLATIGETTGQLPEIFHELEKYYTLQQKLRRQFRAQIMWPVFQFFAGVFVIAGMIWILGLLAPAGVKPLDPLGLGLTGTGGALTFLALVFGILFLGWAIYRVATRSLKRRASVEGVLLKLPAVGPCLYSFALQRYCLAQRLTLEAALPIDQAVRLSLEATGNAAFADAADVAVKAVKAGQELTTALTRTRRFEEEFLHIVQTGELSGRLTDVLEQQSDYHAEESSRRLTTLTRVAGYAVWLLIATLMVTAIITMYMNAVIRPLNQMGI